VIRLALRCCPCSPGSGRADRRHLTIHHPRSPSHPPSPTHLPPVPRLSLPHPSHSSRRHVLLMLLDIDESATFLPICWPRTHMPHPCGERSRLTPAPRSPKYTTLVTWAAFETAGVRAIRMDFHFRTPRSEIGFDSPGDPFPFILCLTSFALELAAEGKKSCSATLMHCWKTAHYRVCHLSRTFPVSVKHAPQVRVDETEAFAEGNPDLTFGGSDDRSGLLRGRIQRQTIETPLHDLTVGAEFRENQCWTAHLWRAAARKRPGGRTPTVLQNPHDQPAVTAFNWMAHRGSSRSFTRRSRIVLRLA
jgi:hypothetical protein